MGRSRLFPYLSIWFFEVNFFQEFKILDKYIKKSMANPMLVWTNLKYYFSFYFLWVFLWKKFCLFYNLKKRNGHFLNWRFYFLFGKFKWSKFIFKKLFISSNTINFRKIQNLYLEAVLFFFLEPLFEFYFKFFIFGFRPYNTIHTGFNFLILNIKKYQFTWILFGELSFCLENFNFCLFFSLILKRIWDIFLVKILKSWFITNIFFYQAKKIFLLPSVGSSFLISFFTNLYFEFFDVFFINLLFISKKKTEQISNLQFFFYTHFFSNGTYINIKYISSFSKYFSVFKKGIIEVIRYIRIYQTLFFCTNYTFYFILLLKEKLISFLQTKFFFNIDQIMHLTIRNVFQGLSIFGFSLKKKKKFVDLYIEKIKVVQYLKFKGFCNKVGFPLPCLKFFSWTQINLHLKINFLIQLLNFWWFKGINKIQIMFFFLSILRKSFLKLYSNKYQKGFLFKCFNLSNSIL